jgi:glycerol-3-phosphate cytidylyltransferase
VIQKKKYKVGYTAGVFDLFHIGHLNILRRAKEQCEYLIVAVSTDELVQQYKNKTPVIPYDERKAIVEAIKYVDEVVPQVNRDKIAAFEKYHFDVMFVGDDWKGSDVFETVDAYMRKQGGCVVYLPYTQNISSTILKEVLNQIYKNGQENKDVHI